MHMTALCGDCCPKTLQKTAVLSGHITSAPVESRYLKTSVSSECFGRVARREPKVVGLMLAESWSRILLKRKKQLCFTHRNVDEFLAAAGYLGAGAATTSVGLLLPPR